MQLKKFSWLFLPSCLRADECLLISGPCKRKPNSQCANDGGPGDPVRNKKAKSITNATTTHILRVQKCQLLVQESDEESYPNDTASMRQATPSEPAKGSDSEDGVEEDCCHS
jgi:hypothetical protein